MNADIRDWQDEDVDWWVALRHAWSPDFGEEQLRDLASGRIARFLERKVITVDGVPRGAGVIAQPPVASDPYAAVLVEPEFRDMGLGSKLFAVLLASHGRGPLGAIVLDGDDRSLAVATHWGFREASHGLESVLAIDADHPPVGPELADGLELRVLEDEEVTAEWIDPLLRAASTHPEAAELGWTMSRQSFATMFPGTLWVVIEQAGSPVALASGVPQGDGMWVVVFTCVLPERRGAGLARMAKQHLHAAADRGATLLTTYNEASNEAILALNASLGYERRGGEYRLTGWAGSSGSRVAFTRNSSPSKSPELRQRSMNSKYATGPSG